MKTRIPILLAAAGLVALTASRKATIPAPASQPDRESPDREKMQGKLAALPLPFEPNRGQAATGVDFQARAGALEVGLGSKGARIEATGKDGKPFRANLRFPGSREVAPSAAGLLPGTANYFRGSKRSEWYTGIPTYREIRYPNLYPGIDLVYYGRMGELEYDFVVEPGADPSVIRVAVTDEANRALPLMFQPGGDLEIRTGGQRLTMHRPRLYQEVNGERREIAGNYRKTANSEVAFGVESYDRTRPLVLDPVISFSTYLHNGGGGSDLLPDVATDSSGNAYLAGSFSEAWVLKLNSAGTAIVYSTFIGGTTQANTVAVDGSGHAYVAGRTVFDNLPTVNPFQAARGGADDCFVAKLAPDGASLVYSTYFGGPAGDYCYGIAVDGGGRAYFAGATASVTGFPLLNAVQTAYRGGTFDAFVAAFTAGGNALVYSTYLGGGLPDLALGIAVTAGGEATVTGYTQSGDFPVTPNVAQSSLRGTYDAFVTSLNTNGSALRYSTYLGGGGWEVGRDVALDAAGNAYLTGWTGSADFPVGGGPQTLNAGGRDAFVTVMDGVNSFSKILYSTYLGGLGDDEGGAVAVDSAGSFYVVGATASTDFPLVRAIQPYGGGPSDGFVVKLRATPGPYLFSTYLGGSGRDLQYYSSPMGGVAAAPGGSLWITGSTTSADFPTVSPLQSFDGVYDGFATKLAVRADLRLTITDAPDPVTLGNSVTNTLSVTNLGPDVATNVVVTAPRPAGTTLGAVTPSQGSCTGTATVTCRLGTVSGSATIAMQVTPTAVGSISSSASVTRFEQDPVSANNSATATTAVRTRLGVTVNGAGGTGTVTSIPQGINCGSDCEEFYTSVTTVRLQASPGANSQFTGWSGACTGTGLCLVSMSQNRNVTANFGPIQ